MDIHQEKNYILEKVKEFMIDNQELEEGMLAFI